MEETYRVLVRGRFGELDDAARAELLAAADDHDVISARFTAEGSLTYERSLVGFTFRYTVAASGENAERDARDEALLGAEERLTTAGYPFRDLRADATNMSAVQARRRVR
ncbi:DUF6204 family protein [Amycolatopsis antarctica]|nr:DUF6204 family protein [Amycolatopsis antarctica]